MKKLSFLLLLILSLCLGGRILADEIDYTITAYRGQLTLADDNTATYQEAVTYNFEDDFNGQYVTLGSAGNMPTGFAIDSDATTISATKNGKAVTPSFELTDLGDGYQAKVYNAGSGGDEVTVTVTWHLTNLLFAYADIAELNWTPISDWDEPLHSVSITVSAPSAEQTQLFAHMGYFREQPTVSQEGADYQIKTAKISSGGKLELHAYWSLSAFSEAVQSSASQNKHLTHFQKTETSIERNSQLANRLFRYALPLICLALILFSWIVYRAFLAKVNHYLNKLDKNARLYEAPQNLAPMVLADSVFGLGMAEANPNSETKNPLTFENIVQATMLDLIDRGIIIAEQQKDKRGRRTYLFKIADKGQPRRFEQTFLRMVFGHSKQAHSQDFFAQYDLSSSILDTKAKSQEQAVRRQGRNVLEHFDQARKDLATKVSEEQNTLGLESSYRPMVWQEVALLNIAYLLAGLGALLSILSFFYVLIAFDFWLLVYLPLPLMAAGMLWYFSRQTYRRDGVLTQEGAQNYYYWQSYRNMLESIASFDQAELESVVLWNRVLVYASLFGCAEQVNEAIKLNHIHFDNAYFNDYVDNRAYFLLMHQPVSRLATSSHTAQVASHFHVYSSSGSSGVFSGGGFSGGGGGGGGGAF